MEHNVRLTQEEVDKEIRSLEKRYKAGEEKTDMYKLKIDNLRTIKDLLIPDSPESGQKWQKKEGS